MKEREKSEIENIVDKGLLQVGKKNSRNRCEISIPAINQDVKNH